VDLLVLSRHSESPPKPQPWSERAKKKERSAEPRPLLEPPPRGVQNSTWPTLPYRERGPRTASVHQGLIGPRLAVFQEANTGRSRVVSNCRSWPLNGHLITPCFSLERLLGQPPLREWPSSTVYALARRASTGDPHQLNDTLFHCMAVVGGGRGRTRRGRLRYGRQSPGPRLDAGTLRTASTALSLRRVSDGSGTASRGRRPSEAEPGMSGRCEGHPGAAIATNTPVTGVADAVTNEGVVGLAAPLPM
jgi:hypothetical protein